MENTDMVVKPFDELTPRELYEILKLRFDVFVLEQSCFYDEFDRIDYHATHYAIWDGDHVVCHARLYWGDAPGEMHIGRVVNSRRGVGVGKRIMRAAMADAWRQGAQYITIDAQCYVIGFYQDMGFNVISEPFDDCGILHVKMRCDRP